MALRIVFSRLLLAKSSGKSFSSSNFSFWVERTRVLCMLLTAPMGVLISWAIPATSMPSEAIFSDCTSCICFSRSSRLARSTSASARRRSVTSIPVAMTYSTSPPGSVSAVLDQLTTRCSPLLVSQWFSWVLGNSPALRLEKIRLTSSTSSGSKKSSQKRRPRASSRV